MKPSKRDFLNDHKQKHFKQKQEMKRVLAVDQQDKRYIRDRNKGKGKEEWEKELEALRRKKEKNL